MSKSGGVFQIDDVTRTMSKGGGAPGVPPIQVQTHPPPGWLATGLHIICRTVNVCSAVLKNVPCMSALVVMVTE